MTHHPLMSARRLGAALMATALLVPTTPLASRALATAAPATAAAAAVVAPTLTTLLVEKKSEPVGIDVDRPRFTWVIESDERGVTQESYRLRVTTEDDTPVWDSGVVASDESANVEYDGPGLAPATGYRWTVDVVTSVGEAAASSTFRSGLMSPADWQGSSWIGNERAGEPMSIDGASWIWTPETGAPFAPGEPRAFRTTRTSPAGSTATSADILITADDSFELHVNGALVDATQGAVNEWQQSHLYDVALQGARNVFAVRTTNGANTPAGLIARIRVHYSDATTADFTTDATWKAVKQIPAGWTTSDFDDSAWPAAAVQAAYGSGPWGRGVRAPQTDVDPAPLLRKEFTVSGDVANATIYVAAGGYADVSLNGSPISDDVLSPGFTDYDDTAQYVGTDITDQLEQGANALGLELGRGFYGMTGGNVWNWQSPPWHDDPVARAVLEIEYADGSVEHVVTDESWTIHDGPTRFDDLYGGELYDASQVQPGYDTVGFDDSSWRAASEVNGPQGVLVDQRQQPIRVTESLPAVEITEPVAGTYVVKFPRVLAGWVRYTAEGPVGTTIRSQAGEKLLPSGLVNVSNNGNFQSGFQTDRFVLAGTGAPETWTPRFSYKGFQYLQVTGWPGTDTPPLSAFTAQAVHTDAPVTGSFESASATMNATHQAVVDTLANNIHGIPTDTPMFEKNGWTGDAAVGAEMFMLNFDVSELFAKWMRDVHETRDADGAPMVIAPSSGSWGEWGVAPPWHSAYILIPWWLYQYNGDDRVLRKQYDGMKGYVDLEFGRSDEGLVTNPRLGDWVSPEASPAGGNAPEDTRISGTAYLYTMLTSMARSAEHLGRTDDAAHFAENAAIVKDTFNATFLDTARGYYRGAGDRGYRQTHNVLAVQFGLTPDAATEQRVVDSIAADVVAKGVHLNTGVLGTKYLLPVLTSHGYADLAYDLAVQTTYPSWGYLIEQGATSMWEHWSLDARSRGHYFLGTVDDWFYHSVAGIEASEETGYRDVTIAPAVTDSLDWARATTGTPYGPVTSDWRHDNSEGDGDLVLDVTVPVGATGHVVVPAPNAASVVESGGPATAAEGVSESSYDDGALTLTTGSGHYSFRVDADLAVFGRILDRADETEARADVHHDVGDLSDTEHASLTNGLDTVRSLVGDAITAVVAGDDATAATALGTALTTARAQREQVATSDISRPVRGDLVTHLDRLVAAIEATVSARLGVAAVVAPLADPALPGDEVSGAVTVTNVGSAAITDLSAVVAVGDWDVTPATLTLATLEAGGTATLPFAATVPEDAAPGGHDASVSLTFSTAGDTYTVSDSAQWVVVTSGLAITDVTMPAAASPEQTTVSVTVANTGTAALDGRIELTAPDGWPATVPSEPLTVPAGARVTTEVPLLVPRRIVATSYAVDAAFVRGDDTLAASTGPLGVALATPPTAPTPATDWVDFGDNASETAHALEAAPSSDTSTEAGLTRRYANSTVPGAWYSAVFAVPAGQPFVLRMRETFDGATTKEFNLYADGVLAGRYSLSRTRTGTGWLAHQVVVDSPAVLAETADGSVRLKFEFPLDASGYDPSIADAWTIPATADDLAPLVSAGADGATASRHGWHRGPVDVSVQTGDNRDASPLVQVGGAGGWTSYDAPVRVTAEGVTSFSYRAKDAAGNSSGARALPVRIDTVAPATTVTVTSGRSDTATLAISATDATSGVDTTRVRVDGGAWQVSDSDAPTLSGFGQHVVEVASTDVAGNAEPVRRTTVTLADVSELVALADPSISGRPEVGRTLTATGGTWNTDGVALTHQWLRSGSPIAGATNSTYRPTLADVGKRLSVQVTASKSGIPDGRATSEPTTTVTKASSTVTLRAPASAQAGSRVRVTITVTSPSATPTGQVVLRLDGARVRTVRATGSTVQVLVKLPGRGVHRLQASYAGSPAVKPATSPVVRVRAR